MKKYRKNVGVVVFNRNKKVLMCSRANTEQNLWQFPQGGIEAQEDVVVAAKRELQEETGIVSVEYVAQTKDVLRYDFPLEVIENIKKCGHKVYDGQEQRWLLFEFVGNDSEINFFTHPEEIEFKDYEWVDIEEAPKRIVDFKKEVYKQVVSEFKPYVK